MSFLSKAKISKREGRSWEHLGDFFFCLFLVSFYFFSVEIFWSWCLKLSGSNVYEFPHPCHFYWLRKASPSRGGCLYTCSRHLSAPLSSAVLPGNAGRLVSNAPMWAASAAKSMSAYMGCLFRLEKVCWRMQRGRQAVERSWGDQHVKREEPGVVFKEGTLISLMSGNETWQMSKVFLKKK